MIVTALAGLVTWGADPLLLLQVSLATVVAAGSVLLFMRVPKLAVIVMFAPALLSALNIDSSILSFGFGGIRVYPADAVYSCALLAAIPLVVRNWSRLPIPAIVMLLWSLLVLALAAIGVATYSLTSALNEFRGAYYALPPAIFVFTYLHGRDNIRWLLRLWVVWAVVLCGIALLHWAQHGIGSSNSMVIVNGQETTGRGLPARASLDIAQAALLLVFAGRELLPAPRLRGTLVAGFLVVDTLLQHRTVWALLIASLAVGMAMDPWSSGKRLMGVVGSVYIAATAALVLVVMGSSILTKFAASWHEMFKPNSTAMWRLKGWSYLLRQFTDLAQWFFGRPFGAGWLRFIDSKAPITDPPHNEYVQTLLRGGVVGLLLLLLVYLLCWRGLRTRRPLDIALRTVLCAQIVYFVAYWLDMEQGIVLGVCLAAASAPATTWQDRWRGAQPFQSLASESPVTWVERKGGSLRPEHAVLDADLSLTAKRGMPT